MFRWCVFFYLLGINTAVNFFNFFFRRSSVHDIAYEDNRAISPAPQTFVPPPLISPSPPRRQEPRSPRKSPRRPSSPPTKAVSRQQHCCRSDTDIILKRHLVLPFPYVKKWQKKIGFLLHLSITLKRKLEPQMILFSSSDSPLSVFICWGSITPAFLRAGLWRRPVTRRSCRKTSRSWSCRSKYLARSASLAC